MSGEYYTCGGTNTIDMFIRAVPWGWHRTVLVHRRRHGWRDFVRFRTWNQHRVSQHWYPSRRFFIIPMEHATELAHALRDAANGNASPKPDWLVAREAAEDEQLERMAELGVAEDLIGEAQSLLKRDRRGRI